MTGSDITSYSFLFSALLSSVIFKRNSWLVTLLASSLVVLTYQERVAAIEPSAPKQLDRPALQPDLTPPDLEALRAGKLPPSVVTATDISQVGLTTPSLWWIREQVVTQAAFSGKLLQNWMAYPVRNEVPGRVDLIVNRQFWSLLDYLQRYEFISRFSAVARSFGYNTRVFDDRAKFLGAYTCDFSSINPNQLQLSSLLQNNDPQPFSAARLANLIRCDMALESGGRAGLRGGTNPLGEGFSR